MPINRETLIAAVIFGILSFAGNLFTGHSLETVSPPITSVILRTQTIMIILLSGVVLKEKLSFYLIGGAIIAIFGIGIISSAQGSFTIHDMMGIIWAALSALSFAVIQLVNKFYIERIHPLSLNLIRMVIATIFAMIFLPNLKDIFLLTPYLWGLCAFASIFGTTISRLASLHALKYIPVSHSTLISTTTPVFTLLISALVIQDWPSSLEMTGGIVVILGLSLPLIHKLFSGRMMGIRSRLLKPWAERN